MEEMNRKDTEVRKEFCKVLAIGGLNLIAPIGQLSEKGMPPGYIYTELDDTPPEYHVTLNELVSPYTFKPMVESVYNLPDTDSDGDIRVTKDGKLFMCMGDKTWIFLSSAG